MLEYEELRIRIWRSGTDRYLVLANGPFSAAGFTRFDDPPRTYWNRFNELIGEAFTDKTGEIKNNLKSCIQDLGRELFKPIFIDSVRQILRSTYNSANDKAGIRLRFDLAPELIHLPLETLCSPATDPLQALALSPRISIVQSLGGLPPKRLRLPNPGDEPGPMTLVVVVSSPEGEPQLDVSSEIEQLENNVPPWLRRKGFIRCIGGPKNKDRPTRARLTKILRDQGDTPCAILIAAHGRPNAHNEIDLLLETEDRTPDPVSAEALRGLLAKANGLRLSVLNLCFGAEAVQGEPFSGLARALVAEGVPAVVAMRTAVSDHAASKFSPALFKAIWENKSIDEAVWSGRSAMESMSTEIEWCNPVLFLHEDCGNGWLFKIPKVLMKGQTREDPLQTGAKAVERVSGMREDFPQSDLEVAVRFWRQQRRWEEVRNCSSSIPDLEGMAVEADLELQLPIIKQFCDELTQGNFKEARERLKGIQGNLPHEIFQTLEEGAKRLEDEEAESYRQAQEAEDCAKTKEDWKRVSNLYQQHVKCYPNDARAREGENYANGRLAEFVEDWSVAASAFESVTRGRRDIDQRLPYVKGRNAEMEKKWEEASRYFRESGTYQDSEQRASYAQGRAEEENMRWQAAADAFRLVPQNFLDVRQRAHYAAGRAAGENGDWQGVIDGFGTLPDEYKEGEVRNLRSYARGRVAVQNQNWAAVIEALQVLPTGYGDGISWLYYAEGRRAEQQGNWSKAVDCYAKVGDNFEDLRDRRLYAVGRSEELREAWDQSISSYQSLPSEYLDSAKRVAYIRGRLAEEQGRWEEAAELYEYAGEHYPDAFDRAAYARGMLAESRQDWGRIESALQSLPETYRNTGKMKIYARARISEAGGDWERAALLYAQSSGHIDSLQRGFYSRGRSYETVGEWGVAIEAYRQIDSLDNDWQQRLERIIQLVKLLPFVDGLASAGLIADPNSCNEDDFPYKALKLAGITPNSSFQQTRDAAYVLMEKGVMTPEARQAWDEVRSVGARLEVDACLFRVHNPGELIKVQLSLAADSRERVLEILCREIPGDAPLFRLLFGDREGAIDAWEMMLRQQRVNTSISHTLAIAYYWHAMELEENGAYEQAENAWGRAIAHWTRVLSDDRYWTGWAKERAEHYQQAIAPGDVAQLRATLGERFLNRLSNYRDHYLSNGKPERADKFQRLLLTLQVELEAARILKEVGGIPLDDHRDARLLCGPSYVRYLGLESDFARLVASLASDVHDAAELEEIDERQDVDSENKLTPQSFFRLRSIFSELGSAMVLLGQNCPSEAIKTLPDHFNRSLQDLSEDCDDSTRRSEGHLGACPHCGRFWQTNISYLFLPHRRARLHEDAVEWATRSYLDLMRSALTLGEEGVEEALRWCKEAIEVSRNSGAQVRTKQTIVRMLLGRIKVLDNQRGAKRGRRLTEAIVLLERVRPLIGAADRGELTAKAAELLTDRGVWYAYGCNEWEDADYEKAAQDLRRALELNPGSLDARCNLSRALVFNVFNLKRDGDRILPFKFFAEAIALLNEGQKRTGGHRRLEKVFHETLNGLEEWILFDLSPEELSSRIGELARANTGPSGNQGDEHSQKIYALALEKHNAGDNIGALVMLIPTVRRNLGDEHHRQLLYEIVVSKSRGG
jgi:tetratricopeptide (TPR) repeat protein